jgi:hypothetical protein
MTIERAYCLKKGAVNSPPRLYPYAAKESGRFRPISPLRANMKNSLARKIPIYQLFSDDAVCQCTASQKLT